MVNRRSAAYNTGDVLLPTSLSVTTQKERLMLDQLMESVRPLRQRLIDHPIYEAIDSPDALRCFMEHHVFAVWDFMSLLKALQIRLTCVTVPWTPSPDRAARRLVNEIVLAEESDEDGNGAYASHFECYLEAMTQAGADVGPVQEFVRRIAAGESVPDALESAQVPPAARAFVSTTWDFVTSASLPTLVAGFTVGREDLIPDLFRGLVERITASEPVGYETFIRYLDRHVHLDGDEHGPMALNLLKSICEFNPDRWREATSAATRALDSRRELWDGVVREVGQLVRS